MFRQRSSGEIVHAPLRRATAEEDLLPTPAWGGTESVDRGKWFRAWLVISLAVIAAPPIRRASRNPQIRDI